MKSKDYNNTSSLGYSISLDKLNFDCKLNTVSIKADTQF